MYLDFDDITSVKDTKKLFKLLTDLTVYFKTKIIYSGYTKNKYLADKYKL